MIKDFEYQWLAMKEVFTLLSILFIVFSLLFLAAWGINVIIS